jgi:uncharacterized membrane protein
MNNSASNRRVLKNRLSIRQIGVAGILSALSVALNFTPLAFPLIPGLPVQITFMHIPVIIGAILEGPAVGAFIGFIFGLSSFYIATTSPLPIAFVFLNPLVSVLPRVLIGVVTYYVYRAVHVAIKGKKAGFSIGLAAAAGALTNTIGVLGMIYILYAKRYVEALGLDVSPLVGIFGLTLPNASLELVAAILLVTPIALAVKKARREL